MCQINGDYSNVAHHYNPDTYTELMDSTNPNLGFTSASVSVNNGVLTCSVTRKNALPVANYFDITSMPYYILFAQGQNDEKSKLC